MTLLVESFILKQQQESFADNLTLRWYNTLFAAALAYYTTSGLLLKPPYLAFSPLSIIGFWTIGVGWANGE